MVENKSKRCALILGGYVNGYNIIRALYDNGVHEIFLFDTEKRLGKFSNKIISYREIEKSSSSLLRAILDLRKDYNLIVIFPTDDLQVKLLREIYYKIVNFCFIPFNPENVLFFMDKNEQYKECRRLRIPYPQTIIINKKDEINKIMEIKLPVLIKPATRLDLEAEVFRSLKISNIKEYRHNQSKLVHFLEKGISMIASEIIPGDDSNIYAYVGYRDFKGYIISEWIGGKLSQFPDDFGVFSSASNEAPEIIREQGRTLLNGMNLFGINQPEFKYDARDGLYKLMEINLRSMMWHRMGLVSGINLPIVQYFNAVGKVVPSQSQEQKKIIHFIYFKHEIGNFLNRKKYFKKFFHNLFKGNEIHFAVFDFRDPLPFLYDLIKTIDMCLKIIINKFIKNIKR